MQVTDFHTHLGTPRPQAFSRAAGWRALAKAVQDLLPGPLRAPSTAVASLLEGPARALAPLAERAGKSLGPLEAVAVDAVFALSRLARNREAYLGPAPDALVQLLSPLAAPIFERSYRDATREGILRALDRAHVRRAVVLPVEPLFSTEETLALCAGEPRLCPFASLPPRAANVGERLEALRDRGARGLKLHPPLQDVPPEDPWHFELLEAARALSLPVVAHTGFLPLPGIAHPEYAEADRFEPLVRAFPDVPFVLAHMNGYAPEKAIRLARAHEQVLLEVSWQPEDLIARALAAVGPERLLFGSDWPILGDRMAMQADLVARAMPGRTGDAECVFERNAARLLDAAPPAGRG